MGHHISARAKDGRADNGIAGYASNDLASGYVESPEQMQFGERVRFWGTTEFRLYVESIAHRQLNLQHASEKCVSIAINDYEISHQSTTEWLAVKLASSALGFGIKIDERFMRLNERHCSHTPGAVERRSREFERKRARWH